VGVSPLSSRDLATLLIEQRVLCLKITCGFSNDAFLILSTSTAVLNWIQFIYDVKVLLVDCFATDGQPYFLLAPQLINDTVTRRIAADKMIFFIVWNFIIFTKLKYLTSFFGINVL